MDVPPPPPSSRTFARAKVNANTRVASSSAIEALEAIDLREAYRIAGSLERTLPPMAERGYRIFRVSANARTWIGLPARRDAYAILGRHTQCDLALDGDPEVALRHLMVRAELAPGGEVPMLRVLDLFSTLGFCLEDGERQSSVLVVGALAFRIGRHAIVALPSPAPGLPSELPPAVVEPAGGGAGTTDAFLAGKLVGASPYRAIASNAPSPVRRYATHVSLFRRSSSLHELRSTGEHAVDGGRLAGLSRVVGRLLLERGGQGQSVDVRDDELSAGILIGRACKCDPRFAPLLDDKVSRAHLLVIRDEGEAVAFDLASINGTTVRGARVRRHVLPDTGASLALGQGGVFVRWEVASGESCDGGAPAPPARL